MSERIAFNTAATYARTLLSVALALLSSRWLLNALGTTDFGLFHVVGSLIIFITFLNTVLAGSASRHFAYHFGQGDSIEVNRWFNSAFTIHVCLAILLLLIGWPIGEYVIGHVLTIPEGRISASLLVFRFSLASAFVSMVAVPFVAMFTANQRFGEIACWGVIQSILCFALAWSLRHITSDRLLFYAVGMVTILVCVQLAQITRAMSVFVECRINRREWFVGKRFKAIFSFATWTLIGNSGALLRDQGSAILLNLFFGPGANAAYGIAAQVSNQANQLSASMIGAFSPEITACEGRGDRARMLSLSQRASKFGTILVLLVAVPLLIEMDYVLALWLRMPPPETALFCQLILGAFVIDRLSTGYMLAVNACGRVAAYQGTLGTILLLTLPLAWLFLEAGLAPSSIGYAFMVTTAIMAVGRVLWGRHLFGIPISEWFTRTVRPTVIVAFSSAGAAFVPHLLLSVSNLRLILVISLSLLTSLLSAWLVAFDTHERDFAKQILRRFMGKIGFRLPVVKSADVAVEERPQ